MTSGTDRATGHIESWLETFVVGLNLCPFARPLLGADNLRIAVCEDTDPEELQRAFLRELDLLQGSDEDEIATTLLAFPAALAEFEDYLDFLDQAQELLGAAGLEGVVQLASFHPQYQFAGEPEGAASHYSNRSPYPMLHLIREAGLSAALQSYPDPEQIPERNIGKLRALGLAEMQRRLRLCRGDDEPESN